MRSLTATFFLFVLSFLLPLQLQAQEFQTEYTVEYFLSAKESASAHAKFETKITDLQSDASLDRYILSFPDQFTVRNIQARDDKGSIIPKLSRSNGFLSIELYFNDPAQNKEAANTFTIEFDQDNIISSVKDTIKIEVPIVQKQQDGGGYHLVINTGSLGEEIVKTNQKPDEVKNGTLIWNDPKVKLLSLELPNKARPTTTEAAPIPAEKRKKQPPSPLLVTITISTITLVLFSLFYALARNILNKKT